MVERHWTQSELTVERFWFKTIITMHYIYCSFAALLSLCGMSYGFEAVKRKVENFDVKPGGMVQTFKIHEVSFRHRISVSFSIE